jgi:flagellar basal-body rod protein FlgB
MLIDQVTNADAAPVLEAAVQFSGRRHALIAHTIANLSTPNFEPMDVSVKDFRTQLSDAVDRRRERFGGARGDLRINSSREVSQDESGNIALRPTPRGSNILFHDRNNRDLERSMQDLVENVATFRIASELLRQHTSTMRLAITGRL